MSRMSRVSHGHFFCIHTCMSRGSHRSQGSKNPGLLYVTHVTGIKRPFLKKMKTHVTHFTWVIWVTGVQKVRPFICHGDLEAILVENENLRHACHVGHMGHKGPKIQAFYMSRMSQGSRGRFFRKSKLMSRMSHGSHGLQGDTNPSFICAYECIFRKCIFQSVPASFKLCELISPCFPLKIKQNISKV